MGIATSYIASSAMIAAGSVTEAKLAAEACSAAKMKKEGTATQVLTSNGAGAVPSYQNLPAAVTSGGSPIFIPLQDGYTSVQGTWAVNFDANYYGAFRFDNGGSRAQNDEITYQVFLMAGTYTFSLYQRKSTDIGIATISIDGSSIGTIDGYAAAPAVNSKSDITGAVVASSGLKTISIKMATKNGSSTHYGLYGGYMVWTRTA